MPQLLFYVVRLPALGTAGHIMADCLIYCHFLNTSSLAQSADVHRETAGMSLKLRLPSANMQLT